MFLETEIEICSKCYGCSLLTEIALGARCRTVHGKRTVACVSKVLCPQVYCNMLEPELGVSVEKRIELLFVAVSLVPIDVALRRGSCTNNNTFYK